MGLPAARANKDSADGDAITTGVSTVFINDNPVAIMSSVTANATIASGSKTVEAGDSLIARHTDTMSNGRIISSGSPDVFIGD